MNYLFPERGASEHFVQKLVGTWGIFIGWFIGGGIITSILMMIFTDENNLFHVYPTAFTNFLILIGCIYLVMRWFKRPFLSLITHRQKFDYGQYFFGFGLWTAMLGVSSYIGYLTAPADYEFTFELETFAIALLLLAIWLPIQTGAEEIFFRGYLPQLFSARISNFWVLLVISSLLFSAPHMANPEAAGNLGVAFAAYALIGATFGIGSYLTGSLEIGMGAHLANNFFGLLIVGYANSAVPGNAIWTMPPADLDQSAIAGVVLLAIWFGLVKLLWPRFRKRADSF